MSAARVLPAALLGIASLLVLLAGLIAVRRAWRNAVVRRQERRVEPVRPLLIALAAADEPDPQLYAELSALSRRQWRAAEPTLAGLLGKIRGGSRSALVGLLEARGTVRRARRRTRRPGAVGRARAAELLGSVGSPGSARDLVRLLGDRNPDVRQVAVRALGRAGAAEAAGHLLRVVAARRSVPTSVLCQALLRLGAATQLTLAVGTRHTDPMVRAVAAETLGLVGAVSAVGPLVALLEGDSAAEVRIRAARALGRIGMPSALAPLLRATRRHGSSPFLRTVATGALGDLGDTGAVPRLTRLLSDPSHRVAATAGQALLRLGPAGLAALAAVAAGDERRAGVGQARDALARGALQGLFADDRTIAEVTSPHRELLAS